MIYNYLKFYFLTLTIFAIFIFLLGSTTINATITTFISSEVAGSSDSSADSNTSTTAINLRLATQNLILPWKAEADALGCSVASGLISGTPVGNTMSVTSNGVNISISTRNVDNTPGTLGTIGGNIQVATADSMQDGAPRPSSLYSFGAQPPYWNDTVGSNSSRNGVLFEFPNPVRGFGAWFADLETRSDQPTTAYMRLFNASGTQIGSDIMINPDSAFLASHPSGNSYTQANCGGTTDSNDLIGCGNETTRFIGFWGLPTDNVSKVLVVVGDDDSGDDGFSERLAFMGPIVANNCGYSLGNQIWHDKNLNNVYNSGELPISSVNISLYEDTNNNNLLDNTDQLAKDIDGVNIISQITNNDGKYLFNNLRIGNYIPFILKSSLPIDYLPSSVLVTDPDDNINNDNNAIGTTFPSAGFASKAITITAFNEPINDEDTIDILGNTIATPIADNNNKTNLTADFGFGLFPAPTILKTTTSLVKVVDNKYKVTYDIKVTNLNNSLLSKITLKDNLNDTFIAPGVYNLLNYTILNKSNNSTVDLNPTYNGKTDTNLTLNSSSINGIGEFTIRLEVELITNNGNYMFTNLSTLSSADPSGSSLTDITSSTTNKIEYAGLSGYIWEDINIDGLRNDPSYFYNWKVELRDTISNLLLAQTYTNNQGYYEFLYLDVSNKYKLQVLPISPYVESKYNFGTDPTLNSDYLSNIVTNISLSAGEFKTHIDAGYYRMVVSSTSTSNSTTTTAPNGPILADTGSLVNYDYGMILITFAILLIIGTLNSYPYKFNNHKI